MIYLPLSISSCPKNVKTYQYRIKTPSGGLLRIRTRGRA
jgi:hypothetical protein